MIHALVRIDENQYPIHVDYYNLDGALKGAIQQGILKWSDDEPCFCMANPGAPRPADFNSGAGSGHTLSQWKRKK